jgi:hypothetical protein
MTISSHESVTSGSAHHTRRETFRLGGGGGGRDTLGFAVMLSLWNVASISVSEVTTRSAVVAAVCLVALGLIARSVNFANVDNQASHGASRRAKDSSAGPDQQFVGTARPAGVLIQETPVRPAVVATRIGSLIAIMCGVGLAIGVMLSLFLVVALSAMNLGAS